MALTGVGLRQSQPADSRGLGATTSTLFSAAWALATVFHLAGEPRHLAAQGAGWSGLANLALAVAAIAVLARPGRVSPLAWLAAGQIVVVAIDAPAIGNHWLLSGLVAVAFLFAVASGKDAFGAFVPVARATLVVAYSFMAFAKVNSGFLDPLVSCSVEFVGDLTTHVGISPLGLGYPIAFGVLCIELSIALLLIVPRTRPWGAVVGLLFHYLVGLDAARHFWDFSSALSALFLLFLPAGFATWLLGIRLVRTLLRWSPLLAVIGLAPAVFGLGGVSLQVGRAAWVVGGGAFVAAATTYVVRQRAELSPAPLRSTRPLLYIVPALAVLNGVSPYVELKTSYSWNMYSNLATTDGQSNHLLVRRTLPLDDHGADLVRILQSDDAQLQEFASTDFLASIDSLRVYLADHPDTALVYERGSRRYSVERAADDAELASPVALWDRKLRPIRAIDAGVSQRCQSAVGL